MSYRIPLRVAHLVDEDGEGDARVFLMPLPDGLPQVLEGSAAVIWLAVAEDGIAAPQEVAALFAGDPHEVLAGVRIFLAELASSGLLTTLEEA